MFFLPRIRVASRSSLLLVCLPLYLCLPTTGYAGCVAKSPAEVHERSQKDPVQILLLGDSTVIGTIPRVVAPEADHLEDIVQKLLDGEGDLPPVIVTNEGRDGEYVYGLLEKRYDEILTSIKTADFISIRYGLNDYGKREDFKTNFVKDIQTLVERLRTDNPKAEIMLETVIDYFDEKRSEELNTRIRKAAELLNVPLIDMYAHTKAEREKGNTPLTYRRAKIEDIPHKYRALLPPTFPPPWKEGQICVLDNRLDIYLRDVPGWFSDQHPNLAGYQCIGAKLAEFLAQRIRERF